MKKKKIIYVPMGADVIHSGHLNVINKAKKYADIVIGLFTHSAIAEYKRFPLIKFQQCFLFCASLAFYVNNSTFS